MEARIIQVLQGHASPAEVAAVRAWRGESPENEALYRELTTLWAGLPEIAIETTPPPASMIRARAEAPEVISLDSRRPPQRRSWIPALAIAASIALLIVAGPLLVRQLEPDHPTLRIEQLATGAAETLMTQLSDGTTVYLAPSSTLRVSETRGVREVWLDGKAFFGVTSHGPDWPFVVRSDRGTVHVLGTRFEFATDEAALRVVVLDGKVDFSSAGENVEVVGGQLSVAEAGSRPVVMEVQNIDEAFDWMGPHLVFENTSLVQAAREIERRFGAIVEVRGEELGRQTISGGFRERTFREVVSTICRVMSAECVIEGARAVISARSRTDVPAAFLADT